MGSEETGDALSSALEARMLQFLALDPNDPVFESVESVSPEVFWRFVGRREETGDLHHYELLNGRIVMTPPAGWPHGEIDNILGRVIGSFVEARKLGRVFGSSQGFELPTGDVLEPDCAFVSNERWAGVTPEEGKFPKVVPDLVVEILSTKTSSRDRGEKRGIYERNGVREYWLVDPRAQRVTRLVLREDRFVEDVFERDAELGSAILDGLRVPVRQLFP